MTTTTRGKIRRLVSTWTAEHQQPVKQSTLAELRSQYRDRCPNCGNPLFTDIVYERYYCLVCSWDKLYQGEGE